MQFPDAGEGGAVAVHDALGLHALVLRQVVERVDAALREPVVVVRRPALRHLRTTELYILCWRDSTQPFDTCQPLSYIFYAGGIPPGPSTPVNHMHRSPQ